MSQEQIKAPCAQGQWQWPMRMLDNTSMESHSEKLKCGLAVMADIVEMFVPQQGNYLEVDLL